MIAQLTQAVGSALTDIALFIPRLGAFLLVLLIGYFVSKALQKATDAILERVGFDRWVERGGVNKALARSKYDASDLLARVVYYIGMLFTLQFAFGVFGPNPVSTLLTGVVAYLPNLFVAGLIVVVGSAIAAAVRDIVDAAMGGLSYGKAVGTVAAIAIITVSVFAALSQLRIAPAIVNGLFYAALAIIAGSAIVAIGGSGIGPMRAIWDGAITRVRTEAPMIREQSQGATERVRQRAQQRTQQAREMGGGQQMGTGSQTGSGMGVHEPEQQPIGAGQTTRRTDWTSGDDQ